MNPELRDAITFGGSTYIALLALYVVLVSVSSVIAGELTNSQWPTLTYLAAGVCVFSIALWSGLNGSPATTALAIGTAPVFAVMTAGVVGTVANLSSESIHLGFFAFFLAGTFVLGEIVAGVGYAIGIAIVGSS